MSKVTLPPLNEIKVLSPSFLRPLGESLSGEKSPLFSFEKVAVDVSLKNYAEELSILGKGGFQEALLLPMIRFKSILVLCFSPSDLFSADPGDPAYFFGVISEIDASQDGY